MCLCPRSCCCWVKSLYTIFNFKMYLYSTEACNVIMPVIINNGSSRLHGHLMSQGHALKFESLVELWRVSQTSEEEPKSLGISSVRLLLGFFRGLKWHIYPKETIKVQLHLLSKKKNWEENLSFHPETVSEPFLAQGPTRALQPY